MIPGLLKHFLLILRLNLRSKQALVYGYLVPIFFLLAFGSVFRSGIPPLMREMGQLLTISTLGGACFGMPTALVAERERGVWRRYRLLPVALGGLLTSTLLARFVIVASAAIMQIFLARIVYGTPFPLHPFQLLIVFPFVAFAFLGLGLVIAALADNVPAVQALGQAIFLPMIMIGGVGVPLRVLPIWAQQLAGFLPGRYAVEAIQSCFNGHGHIAGFNVIALSVIGFTAVMAGVRLFRWDSQQPVSRSAKGWVVLALVPWLAVGFAAKSTGRLKPVIPSNPASSPALAVTDARMHSITFDNLPPDDGTVTPLASEADLPKETDDKERLEQIAAKLDAWPLAHVDSDDQRVRNLLSAAAIADVTEDPLEGQIARLVFDRLKDDFDQQELEKLLAWIILDPDGGTVINSAAELDLEGKVNSDTVRHRDGIYARKFLGRLLGKIADKK